MYYLKVPCGNVKHIKETKNCSIVECTEGYVGSVGFVAQGKLSYSVIGAINSPQRDKR